MRTTFSERTWTSTVMPTMIAKGWGEGKLKATQSVVFKNSESDSRVIGQLAFQYVSSGVQKPFTLYLQTEKAYHWKASKVVYCTAESPAQNVGIQPEFITPTFKVLEDYSISSLGKK